MPQRASARTAVLLIHGGGGYSGSRLVLVAGNHCFDGYGTNRLAATGTQTARSAVQWLRAAEAAAA